MLIVQFALGVHENSTLGYVYGIEEVNNKLLWTFLGRHDSLAKDSGLLYKGRTPDIYYSGYSFPDLGRMENDFVSNEQSELLTGLHYPASMDRLIEIVADHYEPAFSPEVSSNVE